VRYLLASLLVLLALAAPAQAMRFGITDSRPIDLAVDLQRQDVIWNGESQARKLELDTTVVSVWGQMLPETIAGQSAYCSFVSSLLEQNPGIEYLIVWNEPKRYELYGRLLDACSPIIKSFGVKVVGPAMHPGGLDDLRDALDAIEPGALDVFDLHPYLHESELAGLVNEVHRRLGAIPVWVTEDGMDTRPAPEFASLYTGEPWSPAWDYFTEEQQASAVSRYMQLAYCAGASAWFNFLLRDEVDLSRWQSGLERPDGSRKPAYASFVSTAHRINDGLVQCVHDQPTPIVHAVEPGSPPEPMGKTRSVRGQGWAQKKPPRA